MPAARHLIELLRSHVEGDDERFLSVAMQMAAREARHGHGKFARQLKELVDESRQRYVKHENRPVPMVQAKGELAPLVSVTYTDTRLSSMVLTEEVDRRLKRVISEHRQRHKLIQKYLMPRRKILLVGPPGTGKTMTASALAGELGIPLFAVAFDSLISNVSRETKSKFQVIFDAMLDTRGVYFFDEFEVIGTNRQNQNGVDETRRAFNSFLQFLENDDSDSFIVCATNQQKRLDQTLFRRFDDVIRYRLPEDEMIKNILINRLVLFDTKDIHWDDIISQAAGLSQGELTRAADDAAKTAVLSDRIDVTHRSLSDSIAERQESSVKLRGFL